MKKLSNHYDNINIDMEQAIKSYKPYMYERYYSVIVPEMMEKFNIKNINEVPKISKIILSSAISYKHHSLEFLYKIYNCLFLLTGQKPKYTMASKSISQFKIYKKCIIGAMVNLTNKVFIYEFIERFAHIYLPSMKNFNGIRTKNLSRNNFNVGIQDVHIMPEVNQYIGMENFGLTITFVISMSKIDREQILYLLNALDIPVYD